MAKTFESKIKIEKLFVENNLKDPIKIPKITSNVDDEFIRIHQDHEEGC